MTFLQQHPEIKDQTIYDGHGKEVQLHELIKLVEKESYASGYERGLTDGLSEGKNFI